MTRVTLVAEPLKTAQLYLEPLGPAHAEELAPLLADVSLYRFIGGEPPDLGQLRARVSRPSLGMSPDGRESWLNWIIRARETGPAIGTVQATVRTGGIGLVAELAWVVAAAHQGRGWAKSSAQLVTAWLRRHGIRRVCAHIHPGNLASEAVAASIGLRPTAEMVQGERRWEAAFPSPAASPEVTGAS
jgi:RimJ/RimL family protein N-acetyltransferase